MKPGSLRRSHPLSVTGFPFEKACKVVLTFGEGDFVCVTS